MSGIPRRATTLEPDLRYADSRCGQGAQHHRAEAKHGHCFAGIETRVFHHEKTRMLFGDARQSLTQVGQALKSA